MTYKPLAPDYIQFYPTLRCDQTCGFCFNKALPAMDDMPLAVFRNMAKSLAGAGVGTIDIMGGEPTLLRDLPLMIECARSKGMGINVSSNGRDPGMLADIMHHFPGVAVGISVNDRQTLESHARFIEKHRPIVKTVFSRGVDQELTEQILALAPREYYLLYRDALDPADLGETLPFDRFLEAVSSRYDDRAGVVFCSGFLADDRRYPLLRLARCPAGTTKLGVLPDGSVYPCNLFFGNKAYRLGNLLADPFDRIWRHPALTYFRTFSGNACSRTSCAIHGRCHGGCPAHSLAHTGRLAGPDPRCLRD